jgi:hypothetical protein
LKGALSIATIDFSLNKGPIAFIWALTTELCGHRDVGLLLPATRMPTA